MNDDILEIPEDELFDVYDVLADATSAAAGGNPNECVAKTKEARRMVEGLYTEYSDNIDE